MAIHKHYRTQKNFEACLNRQVLSHESTNCHAHRNLSLARCQCEFEFPFLLPPRLKQGKNSKNLKKTELIGRFDDSLEIYLVPKIMPQQP